MSVSDDRTRLQHVIDAGLEIADFTRNVTREGFDSNLPWAVMRGMRNRISHAYFEVNYDLLWNTAVSDVPELLKLIQPIVDDLDRAQGE